jgi:hypothetical protein
LQTKLVASETKLAESQTKLVASEKRKEKNFFCVVCVVC